MVFALTRCICKSSGTGESPSLSSHACSYDTMLGQRGSATDPVHFFFLIFLNHCSQYPMLKYLGNYAVVGKRCLMTHCAQPSRAVCFWGDAFSEQPIVYFISTVVLARMVAILPTSAVNDRTIGSSHTHTHRHIYMLLYFLPCVYSMSFVFFIINPCSNETALSFRVKQNGL